MFRPAGVQVDGQPVGGLFRIERAPLVTGAQVAQVVPGGAHKSVHGVGFPDGGASVGGGGAQETVVFQERTAAGGFEIHIGGEFHRQLVVGDGHRPAVFSVEDGDGASPVALAADQPVPQAVLDFPPPVVVVLQPVHHRPLGVFYVFAVQETGVDGGALPQVGPAREVGGGLDGAQDGQAVPFGELPVPFVFPGHGHDGPGAVTHQHVVGHPHRNTLPVDRVDGESAGVHPGFFFAQVGAFHFRPGGGRLPVVGHRPALPVGGEFLHQRMFGGQHHKSGPEQGVGPGGENFNGPVGVGLPLDGQRESHPGSFGTADPVGLHGHHRVRPVDAVVLQQLLGVAGDAVEPLFHHLLHHRLAGAFVPSVDDLFVGQHGLHAGRPVDQRLPPVGQARLVEAGEEPFRPAVVLGGAGHRFPPPVDHGPHGTQLAPHPFDVGVGPFPGMDVGLDGGVFSGEAEGVEPHREQHVEAPHAHVTGAGVGGGHGVPVADVQVAAGVGQHGQGVVLGARPVHIGVVYAGFFPMLLPFCFHGAMVVALRHAGNVTPSRDLSRRRAKPVNSR